MQITAKVLRLTGRVGSLGACCLVLMFLFGGDEGRPVGQDWLLLAFFPGGVILGMLLAWRVELLGGVITLLSLCAFYVQHVMTSGRLPMGPWFVLMASPGVFFLLAWGVGRLQAASESDSS